MVMDIIIMAMSILENKKLQDGHSAITMPIIIDWYIQSL